MPTDADVIRLDDLRPSARPADISRQKAFKYRVLKRIVDIMGAGAGLVFFGPLLLFIYCWVRCDGGPGFYAQTRVGLDGRAFRCYKFRSMVVDADRILKAHLAADPDARAEWERDFKLVHDPRVTRRGRFLRRTSLDELPQLFNVLRGDMSLVGPRPIIFEELPRYGEHAQLYLCCRPGLSGLWQVSGRSDCDYATRVALDSEYAASWTLWLDTLIIARTVGVVLFRRGAY